MLNPNNKPEKKDMFFDADEQETKYINHLFIRVVAKKKKFTNVDFKYCIFDSAYMRDCVFDSCDFTGCKFIGSNFHNSKFSGCKFDYATFERTNIDSNILNTECPAHENLKLKFARSLRMNFNQLGDADSVNRAILIELDATETHLQKTWNSKEAYYRKKYTGWTRFSHFIKWIVFKFLDFIWGNGENPYKLARSIMLFLALVWIIDFISYGTMEFTSFFQSLVHTPQLFLGTLKPDLYDGIYYTFIQIVRYIFFALMMSILIKRFSRR